MSKVVFDVSMSLDGFVKATGSTPEEPLGKGGERLHEWALGGDPTGDELLATAVAEAGAFIGGRRTYDDSIPFWGADGPTGAARLPLFIVTHEAPEDSPEGGVYTFVTDGIESALRQARQVAGDKNVYVMGGPDVAGQFIRAGLVDEIGIHLVPVLFGGGARLLDHIGDDHIQLEVVSVIDTPTRHPSPLPHREVMERGQAGRRPRSPDRGPGCSAVAARRDRRTRATSVANASSG